MRKSLELESQGYKIISLNIGNPATFGFDAPDEIVHDIILNIRNAQGYSDSRGLFAARKGGHAPYPEYRFAGHCHQ